ncbi:MAG TPA: hypothetical protein DCY13_17210 [Verrucomicrobiales bacterium]|nr:hypothetical protein [Verrucomicrobiales bacterium]
MPSYDLDDVARLRLQDISFFLVLMVISSFVLKLLWNGLAKDFKSLPALRFKHAFGISLLLGLAMLLILTMISGIREVLTPGAWRKQGATYQLNSPALKPERQRSLAQLRAELFRYARANEGRFPLNDFVEEIPEKLWEPPSGNGVRYVYRGGLTTNVLGQPLAWEPSSYGEATLVLLSDGEIVKLDSAELLKRMEP